MVGLVAEETRGEGDLSTTPLNTNVTNEDCA